MKFVTILTMTATLLAGLAVAGEVDMNVAEAGKGTLEAPITPNAIDAQCTFAGPPSGFAINLSIYNNTPVMIDAWGIDGTGANDGHIIWDSFGSFSGPATLSSLTGEDTDRVIAYLSGFDPGETISFSGIDPDIVGDPSFGVTVAGLVNCRTGARGKGHTYYATFYSDGYNTVAVIGPSKAAGGPEFADLANALDAGVEESQSFGAVKSLFR